MVVKKNDDLNIKNSEYNYTICAYILYIDVKDLLIIIYLILMI